MIKEKIYNRHIRNKFSMIVENILDDYWKDTPLSIFNSTFGKIKNAAIKIFCEFSPSLF